jgi:hypothetical protein
VARLAVEPVVVARVHDGLAVEQKADQSDRFAEA